ncbi:MAG: dihydrofolate reductase [Bacilli bacterium]|nr:dihydrofolate reductase [Bacilli bacterium]
MVSIIVAIGKNNVIGKGNLLPWNYPEDLKYFKQTTLNKTVIMGENTFKSIISYLNKPLPKRKSVIATLTDYEYPGVEVTHDIVTYLKNFPKDEEIFVIGGKIIYDIALEMADRLYITHIDKEYEGDVFFKTIDYSKYQLISEEIVGELNWSVYERV